MKTENRILMQQAREALRGRWGLAVGTGVVYMAISGAIGALKEPGSLVSLLVSGPLMVGISLFSLSIARGKDARLEQIFEGFKRYGRALLAYVLVVIFTFLWLLLLVIPGIIAAISYSQTFFILADDDTIGAREAIRKSKKMMDGYKWKYFCLLWRFFGWFLLSILTLGIGFLWFFPYIQVSMARFYDDVKG